jgi:hypothetical protein
MLPGLLTAVFMVGLICIVLLIKARFDTLEARMVYATRPASYQTLSALASSKNAVQPEWRSTQF